MLAVLWLAVADGCGVEAQTSVVLQALTEGDDFRWRDVAGNPYSTAFRESYGYTQASVVVTHSVTGTLLTGTLTATNLKPNFAYQLKLSAVPELDPVANEYVGFFGRWWKEIWDGTTWTNGWNLNKKGDGSSPNSNDLYYVDHRDDPYPEDPTNKLYRFTGYRPYDYFITDENGAANLEFVVDSVYHVLWKTTQSYTHGTNDGPLVARTFEAGPAACAAYDADHGESSATIFGEWERLPMGGVYLPPGDYEVEFLLTEESFHGVDGSFSGFWAHAVYGLAGFAIERPTITLSCEPVNGGTVSPAGIIELDCGGATNVSIEAAAYWQVTNVYVDGEAVGATNAWAFTDVTGHQALVARCGALLATNAVPKWWLAQQRSDWTNGFDAASLGDFDGDGMRTWEEYYAGTQPTNPLSVFRISGQSWHDGTNLLEWVSPCRDPQLPPFEVWRSTNVSLGWELADGAVVPSEDGTNRWGEAAPPEDGGTVFYRIEVPADLPGQD